MNGGSRRCHAFIAGRGATTGKDDGIFVEIHDLDRQPAAALVKAPCGAVARKGGAMNGSFTSLGRLAGALAVVGAVAALTAGSAFADPPNHPRYSLTQAKPGLAHEPEIDSGIASPAAGALPAREPEIVSGIVPPDVREHRLVGQLVQADRLTSQSGFDWGDAGIGAVSALGLMLLAGGMTLVARRRHAAPNRALAR
jgi:hypothetical protein